MSDEIFSPLVLGHRSLRGMMYLLIVLAGVAVFIFPVAFLSNISNFSLGVIGAFLMIGGLVSGAGHFYGVITLERAGYPLVLTALMAMSTELLYKAPDENTGARVLLGLSVLSFTLGLYGRWRDLGTLSKIRATVATEYLDHDSR